MKSVLVRKICLSFFLVAALVVFFMPSGIISAATISEWTQTTQADFAGGTPANLDIITSPGSVKLAKNGSDYVYAFKGNGSNTFWRYDVSAGTWSQLANALANIGAGGSLAYDGGNYIYALAGNGSKYFMRYSISANSWEWRRSVQSAVSAGGALVYTGGNYLYALRGGGNRTFWRYSISGDAWTARTNTPANVYGGGALTYPGSGDFIYALGGLSTNFWKYSIQNNTWTALAATPSDVYDGGSLASDGGAYVYALKGYNTVAFWRYAIANNTWAVMADTPATPCVYGGGALVYDKGDKLYALRGDWQTDFWSYNITGNYWNILAGTPSGVAYGGSLACQTQPYYSSGTLLSSVFDTGAGADFQEIFWNSITPAGTEIKFQLATNNDNATWVFKGPDGTGGSYYTSSGVEIAAVHDGDRFIRYKAYLNTANTFLTPVLNDITITYAAAIVAPLAVTQPASSVEEMTAVLHGLVDDDGGEVCQYRFQWGIAPGVYTGNTSWAGAVATGGAFSAAITGLSEGTLYYYRAGLMNSAGEGSGEELAFLTRPAAPGSFIALVAGDTQIELSWSKGAGALNTLVLRRADGVYPISRDDPEAVTVYFGPGTAISDNGLTPGTTYYYCAWSEVMAGSFQQWSAGYKSAEITTTVHPAAETLPAALVEETTATLNGSVIYDAGAACEYRFVYGTVSGGSYPYSTIWTGAVTAGQTFSADVTGLAPGTKYYYRAEIRNSYGVGTGEENNFLTKPERPEDPVVTVYEVNATSITLTWTKGTGALNTLVLRRADGVYPVSRDDPAAVTVYFGPGTSCVDAGLDPDTFYYYRVWSQVTGSEQWSDQYQDILVKTSLLTPAATTTTTGVVAVGGRVYSVNKEAVMAPLPAFGALAVVFALGVFIILEVIHARRLPRYIRYRRTRLKMK